MQQRSQEIGMQGMDARVRDRQPARPPPEQTDRVPGALTSESRCRGRMLVWVLVSPLPLGKGFRSSEEALSTSPACSSLASSRNLS